MRLRIFALHLQAGAYASHAKDTFTCLSRLSESWRVTWSSRRASIPNLRGFNPAHLQLVLQEDMAHREGVEPTPRQVTLPLWLSPPFVCGLDYTFIPLGWCPSSLYTFRFSSAWLGVDIASIGANQWHLLQNAFGIHVLTTLKPIKANFAPNNARTNSTLIGVENR